MNAATNHLFDFASKLVRLSAACNMSPERPPPDIEQDEEMRLSARYKLSEGFDDQVQTDDQFNADLMVNGISVAQWREITNLLDRNTAADGVILMNLMQTLRDHEHGSRLRALLEAE